MKSEHDENQDTEKNRTHALHCNFSVCYHIDLCCIFANKYFIH